MTNTEDLKREIFAFIEQKKEELKAELEECTAPFLMTIAEPENDDELNYAQKEFYEAMKNEAECDELLCDVEDLLNEN